MWLPAADCRCLVTRVCLGNLFLPFTLFFIRLTPAENPTIGWLTGWLLRINSTDLERNQQPRNKMIKYSTMVLLCWIWVATATSVLYVCVCAAWLTTRSAPQCWKKDAADHFSFLFERIVVVHALPHISSMFFSCFLFLHAFIAFICFNESLYRPHPQLDRFCCMR